MLQDKIQYAIYFMNYCKVLEIVIFINHNKLKTQMYLLSRLIIKIIIEK